MSAVAPRPGRARPLAVLGLAACGLAACVGSPKAPGASTSSSAPVARSAGLPLAVRQAIEARLAGALPPRGSEADAHGAIVVAVHAEGATTILTAGARTVSGLPPDADTLFKVCSVTKVFTGVLLADATLRGRVTLADEAQRHLARVKVPRHTDGPVRLEHLATYSAGLPWQPSNFRTKSDGGYTDEAWRSFLEGYALPYAPGRGFQYGNVGFALLGEALAENAGEPVAALFRNRLFAPLGLERSGFIGERADDANRAQGVDVHGKLVPLDLDEPSQLAACGIETSASDLVRFLGAHFDAPHPLHRAMRLALEPRRHATGDFDGFDVGLGWFLEPDTHRAFKTGGIEGYRSIVGLDLERRTAAVVLAADERIDTGMLFDGIFNDVADAALDPPASAASPVAVPPSAVPYDVAFDDGLRLVGIEAPEHVASGGEATVRYFYRVERTPRFEWRAFVHADANGERVRSNHVLARPMRTLAPGTLVEDVVTLRFRPDLKNTTFTLYGGFYRGDERMGFASAKDDKRVVGPKLRIVPSVPR